MDTYTFICKTRYAEGDRHGLLKLRAFFDLAQEAAGEHAAQLGVGMKTLLANHRAWMLSRVAMRISSYPRFGEEVRITTWPAGFERLLARRELRFADADGREFAAMTMLWMIVDTENMSIIPAPVAIGDSLPHNPELPHAFDNIGKLPAPEAPEMLRCTVRESQLDVNCHLNNAEYAALVQDCLGAECRPTQLQINFHKGIPPLGEVEICGGVDRQKLTFNYAGRCNGTVAFTAAGTLLKA